MESRTHSPSTGNTKHDKGNEKTSRTDRRSGKKKDVEIDMTPSKTAVKSKTKVSPDSARQEPSESKGPGVPSTNTRSCKEHTTLTNVADVRQMEQGLLQLLEDFHSGKLQVFGQDCSFEKMDHVREQQERLARRHFEIDSKQELRGFDTPESRKHASENMSKLMESLHDLTSSIQNLQKKEDNPGGNDNQES